jgi:hypothetical protein
LTCLSSAYNSLTTFVATVASVYGALVKSLSSSSLIVTDIAKYKLNFIYTPPEATTTSALAPSATLSSSNSECLLDSLCKGNITYYIAGLGACRITSDRDIQNVVALPHSLIGTKSNNNPYCNKTITITCIVTGKTTTATVVDKCIRCNGFLIDLSNAAFLDLDDLTVSCTNATWYFN